MCIYTCISIYIATARSTVDVYDMICRYDVALLWKRALHICKCQDIYRGTSMICSGHMICRYVELYIDMYICISIYT